jgi:hypothetical protein
MVNQGALSSIAVYGAQIPREGPKAVSVPLNFVTNDQYTLDYGNEQYLGRLSMVQTIFVDASNVDVPVQVQVSGTNQVIIARGRTQGYYAVCAANPFRATFTCAGGGAPVQIQLLNYPVTSAQWPSQ